MKWRSLLHLLLLVAVLTNAGSLLAQKQGQALVDSLISELPKRKDDTVKVKIYSTISINLRDADPSLGIRYGDTGMILAEKLGWPKGKALLSNSIGVNYHYQSNYPRALEYYNQALTINEESGNRRLAAQNLGNMAIMFEAQGDYPKALDYLFRALKIFEDIGDTVGITTQLGNIGNVYDEQKNYQKTLEYDSMALRNYRRLGDKDGEAIMLGNLSNVFDDLGQSERALRVDSEAVKIYEELGSNEGVARNLNNMGEILAHLNRYPLALATMFRSMRMFADLGSDGAVGRCYSNIGGFYLNLSEDSARLQPDSLVPASHAVCLKLAITYLTKATGLLRSSNSLDYLSINLRMLSAAERKAGMTEEALKHYEAYTLLKDSLFSTENNVKISNLETKRALDLKDKQIELDRLAVAKKRNERGFFIAGIAGMLIIMLTIFRNYKKQKLSNTLLRIEKDKVEQRTEELNIANVELKKTLSDLNETQEQLIEAEKQKENALIRNRISQDIHDDISSELTRISWMSESAKMKWKKAATDEVPPLLEKIVASSRNTIGKLGEIIWVVNPANDNMENLVAYLKNYISGFFTDTSFAHTINIPAEVPKLHVSPEVKRNLLLVVKESLNNAVKYSEAHRVTVTLMITDHQYSFTIADDGRGIDEAIIHGGGNGLKNMKSRMAVIKGSCTISSAAGKGTSIVFQGPVY